MLAGGHRDIVSLATIDAAALVRVTRATARANTRAAFTGLLAGHGIAISMDGKGAWRDNVFVERLWRSVKYEEVYLRAYETVGEARHSIIRSAGISTFITDDGPIRVLTT